MTTRHPLPHLLASLCLTLPLIACDGDDLGDFNDAEEIGQVLNEVNGGLDMEDEAPQFGEPALFDAAALPVEEGVEDVIEDDPEVVAMRAESDAMLYHAAIRWGRFPFNPEVSANRDWSGTFRVNRGALVVRQTIAFEGTDALATRSDRLSISFQSMTRSSHDGLRVVVIDPTPDAVQPLILSYSDAGGEVHSLSIKNLLGAPDTFDAGSGDKLVTVAIAQPAQDCELGFLGGRWHKVAQDRGRMLGRVVSVDGETLGHIRGVYGRRENGNRVFFGKYINTEGSFRGIYVGRYQDGQFLGRWVTRDGDIGALGGLYRETVPGPGIGGQFLGRWAEKSCAVEVGPGSTLPDL